MQTGSCGFNISEWRKYGALLALFGATSFDVEPYDVEGSFNSKIDTFGHLPEAFRLIQQFEVIAEKGITQSSRILRVEKSMYFGH